LRRRDRTARLPRRALWASEQIVFDHASSRRYNAVKVNQTDESAETESDMSMYYEAHQPVIDDLEARITTIRDSL